ncbi:hypothetical protein ACWOFR_14730 [Carnobacterium gallinarum]
MLNSKKVKMLIIERKTMFPDDPKINEIWKELTDIFSKDENETINYLKTSPENEIEWISEVFEDISENLQSQNFINILEIIEKKFTNLDLYTDISYAKKALKD